MSIKKEEIEHIAELARLQISAEELKKFGPQLDSILKYIGQLAELKLPTATTVRTGGLTDVWRTDEVKEWDRAEVLDALRQGDLESGHVKVKKVL